nr:vWA domain-containing protein [Corallococcus sp. AS-1-12]
MLVLDMSFSITRTPGRQAQVVQGARELVRTILTEQPDLRLRPKVAIYAFGSTAASSLALDFTSDPEMIEATLQTLEKDPGRGSTNLYGAYIKSLEYLEMQAPTGESSLTSRSLVLLTDGVHETGDSERLKSEALSKLRAMPEDGFEAFAIPVKESSAEFDVNVVCELAGEPDRCFVSDPNAIVAKFAEIANRLDARSRSNYVVGICSPLEGPNRSLSIRVMSGGKSGTLQVKYDATGFNLIDCRPELVLNPCRGRTCGVVGGVTCGSCDASQICSEATGACCTRQCSGRSCGPDGCGGSCGVCTEGSECMGNGVCACSAGTIACATGCVNPQADKDNCLACGSVCAAAPNATPACRSGCSIDCVPGYANCDGVVANGCEVFVGNRVPNDGVFENSYGWIASVTGVGEYVGAFDVGAVPVRLDAITVRARSSVGAGSWSGTVVVYDDNGSGGAPGTPLAEVAFSGRALTSDCFTPTEVGIASNVVVSGRIYVGAAFDRTARDDVYFCADQSPSTQLQPAYMRGRTSSTWEYVPGLAFHGGAYRALGFELRAACGR